MQAQHYNTRPGGAGALARIVFSEEILFASAGGEQRTMNLLPGLARARCPVLVMAGELDPVCPLEDAKDIAAALPARWSRLVTFRGFRDTARGATNPTTRSPCCASSSPALGTTPWTSTCQLHEIARTPILPRPRR